MNIKGYFLILRHVCFIAFCLAMGACSFKKNPQREATVIKIVEQSTPAEIKAPTAEEIIVQNKEEQALELLSTMRLDHIDEIKTVDGSLLDTAIKLNKEKIVNYLILQGHSPFAISDQSYLKLSYSNSLNSIIQEAQKDRFIGIAHEFPVYEDELEGTSSANNFANAIKYSKLGTIGCQSFANFIMGLRYSRKIRWYPGSYYEILNTLPVEKALKVLIQETECSNATNMFSASQLAEWLSFEFLYQFRRNFRSIEFFKFIGQIGKTDSPSINLFNNNKLIGSTLIKANPLLLLKLKKSCFTDDNTYQDWKSSIISKINSQSEYTLNYLFKKDVQQTQSYEELCDSSPEDCDLLGKNLANLAQAYSLIFKETIDEYEINSILFPNEKEIKDPKNSKKIKALCDISGLDEALQREEQ